MIKIKITTLMVSILFCGVVVSQSLAASDDATSTVTATKNLVDPDEVITGFDSRVDRMFKAESGKPLVRAKKNPPLKPGRGNYVRHYSYSMVAYAARCLYLNESLDQANAALVENAQHYIDNPKDVNDRDSFHWHASEVMRLLEMYGPNGTEAPGRLSQETVDICLKPIFMYADQFSNRWEYKKSKTWHIYESENHHAMSFSTCWQFARIARNHPEYKDIEYGSFTPAQHYDAWNEYFVAYCLERARKGMFIEMMSGGYNSTLIKGIYNFYDFGEPEVKRAAGLLLDLYFAYFAQEQIDGIQGGGQSRIYFQKGLHSKPAHGIIELAWYYFGIGEVPAVSGHDLNAALSDYRPPAVVVDLALDVTGRGRYEVKQFPRGLGQSGDRNPYLMMVDNGGIQRYSYCDPAFILGTPMVAARPLEDWAAISSQNRWQGVIFSGETPSRIVPISRPIDNRVALNGFWSVQRKGCLITQKFKSNRHAAEMIVWMSKDGLSKPVEEEGIVFVEAPGAYAAVRAAQSGYTLDEKDFCWTDSAGAARTVPSGWIITPKDEYAPVILEVMAKTDVKNFDDFKQKVKGCKPQTNGTVLSYRSIYGDTLTLDTSYEQTPTVNGKAINYSKPEKVFDSPFLRSEYDSGVVTIEKGSRKLVLDFNKIKRESVTPITIGLIGDSTVASTYGWGPGFADRMRKEGTVLNFARNGATLGSLSKSLGSLLKKKPNYVLIQFGHNDMKRYGTEDYSKKLRNYVERIRKAGAQPVILSSVTRRSMDSDGQIVHHAIKGRRLSQYGEAAGALAREMGVPFVDLLHLSVEQHNRVGPEVVSTYNFVEGDRTHFSPAGEKVVADLVLKEIGTRIPELAPYILQEPAGPRVRKPLSQKFETILFNDAESGAWQESFFDLCTADWKKKWFLDGHVGTVETDKDGMTLTAGKEWKNDAHHMVLWSREAFKGDLKVEYDWTRLEDENRGVNILYVQATGSGKAPYTEDITRWNDLRQVPAMKVYYNNMNTYHISYAAFGNDGKPSSSYIRGRRYMPNKTGLKGSNLWPEYASNTLFAKGVQHHITIIKADRGLFMRIENSNETFYCHMDNTDLPIITEGRIGLRHMFTRSSRYKNLRISTKKEMEAK